MDRYGLPDGYQCNLDTQGQPTPYKDSPKNSQSMQVAVYRAAARLIREQKLKRVLDVGCGLGVKLDRYIAPLTHDITGVDVPACVDHCRRQYLFGHWVADDIAAPKRRWEEPFDLILCADVIEHLADPGKLIAYLQAAANAKTWIVISTPDRELLYPNGALGPPKNPCHVREWSAVELKQYLTGQKMQIIEQSWVASKRPKGLLKRMFGTGGERSTTLIVGHLPDPPKA